MLTSGPRDVVARQQTLRNTIEWSYQFWMQEQQLFRRLSVFVGGCLLEAMKHFAFNWRRSQNRVLDTCCPRGQKPAPTHGAEAAEEPRFPDAGDVREYALERLAASGETEAARRAHACILPATCRGSRAGNVGPQQAVLLERLEQEHDNLREALEWALEKVTDEKAAERREIGLRLSAALKEFWMMHRTLS